MFLIAFCALLTCAFALAALWFFYMSQHPGWQDAIALCAACVVLFVALAVYTVGLFMLETTFVPPASLGGAA